MSVYEKLMNVQSELKAPKGQFNSFGKYKYRSCEDILEAVKPVLKKNKATITIADAAEQIGERVYIKATATFVDVETGDSVSSTAFAREEAEKKGMDSAQITGSASSYARKYCLNGLLLIDDTKDADTDEARNEKNARYERRPDKPKEEYITEKEQNVLRNMCERIGRDVNKVFPNGLKLTPDQYTKALATLKGWGA